jgi:hypothetical protein
MPPVLPVEWKAAVAYPSQSVSYAIAHLKLLFFSFPFLIYDLLSTYLSIYLSIYLLTPVQRTNSNGLVSLPC